MHVHACMLALRTGRRCGWSTTVRSRSSATSAATRPGLGWSSAPRTTARSCSPTSGCSSTAAPTRRRRTSSSPTPATSPLAPTDVPDVRIDGYAVFTNNPPCGAMRGFGAVQACYAIESAIDRLAGELGIDPLELRLRNALVEGTVLPDRPAGGRSDAGARAPRAPARPAAAPRGRWRAARPADPARRPRQRHPRRGHPPRRRLRTGHEGDRLLGRGRRPRRPASGCGSSTVSRSPTCTAPPRSAGRASSRAGADRPHRARRRPGRRPAGRHLDRRLGFDARRPARRG